MKEKIYYSLVPVSEKPEKPDWYFTCNVLGHNSTMYYSNSNGWINYGHELAYWLRPITLISVNGVSGTREAITDLINKVVVDCNGMVKADTIKMQKEMDVYINSLLNK